jgi:hypothetical protein
MKFCAGMLILFSLPLWSVAQGTDSYPLNVHVSRTELRYTCADVTNGNSFCLGPQQLHAVIAGKTYDLAAGDYKTGGSKKGLLPLGDYRAKLLAEEHDRSSEFRIVYEFLLPDGSVRKFAVIGQSE